MFKYFMYSKQHMKEQNDILSTKGKKYTPGLVTVGGTKKQYSKSVSNKEAFISRFIDAIEVASGDDKAMAYIAPKVEKRTV